MDQPDWDTAMWQLLADLRVDHVLALSQVQRRYVPGADETEAMRWLTRLAGRRAVRVRQVWVPRTARARRTEKVVAIEPPGRSARQADVAHWLGLAEMRWCLRVGLLRWQSIGQLWPEKRPHGERPDALAEDAAGHFVVEYDHGAYSLSDVERKRQSFAELTSRQVWGTSSERRHHWLCEQLRGQDVLLVAW